MPRVPEVFTWIPPPPSAAPVVDPRTAARSIGWDTSPALDAAAQAIAQGIAGTDPSQPTPAEPIEIRTGICVSAVAGSATWTWDPEGTPVTGPVSVPGWVPNPGDVLVVLQQTPRLWVIGVQPVT